MTLIAFTKEITGQCTPNTIEFNGSEPIYNFACGNNSYQTIKGSQPDGTGQTYQWQNSLNAITSVITSHTLMIRLCSEPSRGQKQIISGSYAMYAGNGNQSTTGSSDTDINADDRSFWEGQNGELGEYNRGDYNLNGDVNLNDSIVWERNNGRFTSVPRN